MAHRGVLARPIEEKRSRSAKLGILRRAKGSEPFRWLVRNIVAPSYFLTFFKTLEAKIIAEYLEARPGERVCDLACGTGERSLTLTDKGCSSYGIDVDRHSIEMATYLFHETGAFIQADGERLPFKSETFDKALSICALEHFSDDQAALREAYRILKPGGVFVITVDSLNYNGLGERLKEEHKVENHVVRYYTRQELEAKLRSNSFSVESSKYFISSPVAAFFFNLWIRRVWVCSLLYPVAVCLSYLGDRLAERPDQGYLLAVKARKNGVDRGG
ncbi:MAG: class I SAM-dependent methyltransferase [Chloroflexota bacterium]